MAPVKSGDFIRVDQGICHGKPCFIGTRIMVSTVLELLETGQTTPEILQAFPQLTARHVQAALHFASEAVDGNFTLTR